MRASSSANPTHPSHSTAPNVIVAIALIVLALGLSACGGTRGEPGAASGSSSSASSAGAVAGGSAPIDCTELPVAPDAEPGEGSTHTVVLLDGSGSLGSRFGEALAALDAVVEQAAAEEGRITVGFFGATPSVAATIPCLDGIVLAPEGNNGPVREESQQAIPGVIAGWVERFGEEFDPAGGTDPMSAFTAAANALDRHPANGPTRVIIYSDFVATTGCLATVDGEPGSIQDCTAPADLGDVEVQVVGVGRTDPPRPASQVRTLTIMATDACAVTGADCTVITGNLPAVEGD